MARHPNIETCIFCMAFPCECEKPEKPKAAPRKRAAKKVAEPVDSQPAVPTPDPVAPPTPTRGDPRAMMKQAASATPKAVDVTPGHGAAFGTPNIETVEDVDEDTAKAINALEPILHREEKARYSPILDRSDMRAERWRNRNVPPSS